MASPKSRLITRHLASKTASIVEEAQLEVLSKTASAGSLISRFNMWRVAGNVYECPSTKNFWEVKEGKLKRLTKDHVVNNGETLIAADRDNPELSLKRIIEDLDF